MRAAPGVADISFERLLQHAAGDHDPAIALALVHSAELRELMAKVTRMVQISRRSAGPRDKSVESRWLDQKVLGTSPTDERSTPSLGLVFDSQAGSTVALRATNTRDIRFLRYEGEFSVELQIKRVGRGTELRGQVSPHGATCGGFFAPHGRIEREFAVLSDGTFKLTNLPREPIEIDFGGARIAELTL